MALRDVAASDATKGVLGGAAGTAVADATIGLERAWQAAGDALRPIFGDKPPWELAGEAIADIVSGGASEGSGEAAAIALEAAASHAPAVIGWGVL